MFPANKPLPPPPLPEKPSWKSKENAGESSASTTTSRPRPASGGAFASGKLAFSAAKAVFDTVKKPEVQRGLIAASKNETIRSAARSIAKNQGARAAVLNALQDERTLKAASNIAQAYDRQEQNNPSSSAAQTGISTSFGANSEFAINKPPTSLPSSRDYAPYKSSSAATNFTAIHNQLASLNLFPSNATPVKKAPIRPEAPKLHHSAVPETNIFTGQNQEQQPYGFASFQFVASHFDELSVEPNDMIMLEKKVDDQWVYAQNKRTGRKGIIPLVYIDVKIPLPTGFISPITEVPFYARALFDFNSSVPGDLTFRANDEIYVTERVNNDWLRGIIGAREGIFPANYVQEITDPLVAVSSEPVNWNAKPEYITAAYDYNSGVGEDLIFKAGDQIEVLEWVSEDWLKGKLNGQVGMVPRTYILTTESTKNVNIGKQSVVTGTIVTATNDYYNVSSDHLCFSKGDQIEVIEEVNSNWLKGKLLLNMSNTKSFPVGLFPRSAIQ